MACGLDINFYYVLVGQEGFGTDATVLWSASNRRDWLKVPNGDLNILFFTCVIFKVCLLFNHDYLICKCW